MSLLRYGKTGLLGQAPILSGPTYYTPSTTPTPPPPRMNREATPTVTPHILPPMRTPTVTPYISPPMWNIPMKSGRTPTVTPYISPPTMTPTIYQGTPSYVPDEEPLQINPEEAGLYPEGSIPTYVENSVYGEDPYLYSSGGAFGPSEPGEEEVAPPPPEEPPKRNWLLWIALAVGAYLIFQEA